MIAVNGNNRFIDRGKSEPILTVPVKDDQHGRDQGNKKKHAPLLKSRTRLNNNSGIRIKQSSYHDFASVYLREIMGS